MVVELEVAILREIGREKLGVTKGLNQTMWAVSREIIGHKLIGQDSSVPKIQPIDMLRSFKLSLLIWSIFYRFLFNVR